MPKRVIIILILAIVALLVLTGAMVIAAPPPFLSQLSFLQPPRSGTDPLSPSEIFQVQQTAAQDVTLSAQLNNSQRTQLLLVERHQEAKSAQQNSARRADMYVYNYDTNTLTNSIINLDTGAVDSVETVQNVQLPLTQAETEQAIQLALADPQLWATLQTRYQTINGVSLTNPQDQLNFHTLIFQAQAMPDQARGAAANCGLHRCAQLLITTQNGYLVDLLPIVDLSENRVVNVVINPGP